MFADANGCGVDAVCYQSGASQRQQMGADIMNEVYEKLRKDVSSTSPSHEQQTDFNEERAEMRADEEQVRETCHKHHIYITYTSTSPQPSPILSHQEELGETVGSSVLRVSIGGLTATSDSMGGSFEKPTSALPVRESLSVASVSVAVAVSVSVSVCFCLYAVSVSVSLSISVSLISRTSS
jgi:hypothetical protein